MGLHPLCLRHPLPADPSSAMGTLIRVRVRGSHYDHVIVEGTEGGTLCGRLEWRPIMFPPVRKPRVCQACTMVVRAQGQKVPR